MRFDDMLETVLAQPRDTESARVAVWRQLVDLLAQRDDVAASANHIEAFAIFDEWREEIPESVKRDAARALVGRHITPWLVASFAEEKPEIAGPVILEANIEDDEWLALLPAMRGSSRALLRHRNDLSSDVTNQLSRFGAADMVLSGTVSEAELESNIDDVLKLANEQIIETALETPRRDTEQIRELVERIEIFRRERAVQPVPKPFEDAITEFRFEAGTDGVIHWVEGAPRGPLIGQTIAFSAGALDSGVDGHAAGAFRQRAPFRDARLVVAGEGPAAGSWRISAVPFFTDNDGRFAGYRGMARRPQRGEEAGASEDHAEGLFGSTLAPDSLRQLIHELRTPLNAIVGFSEMIDKQLLGPISSSYRERAQSIASEASDLLRSVDDIDMAARAESDRLTLDPQSVDGAEMLQRLHDSYVDQAEMRGVTIVMRIEEDLPVIAADPVAAERMLERLLAATVGLAAQGESISVDGKHEAQRGFVAISISRPDLLRGQSEPQLLDPGYSPDGDWPDAPALGLGFALRLIRNIALEADGRLDIETRKFVLRLPTKDANALSGERGS